MNPVQRTPELHYGRTSKDDRRRLPIENQQATLARWRAMDDSCGPLLLEAWDIGVSGKVPFFERPGGKRVLEMVRQHAGQPLALVVPFVDRFARDTHSGIGVAKELNQMGTYIVSVCEGLDARKDADPTMFNLRLVMAESEWFRIQDRTKRGKDRAMDRDNAPPGGHVQFGWSLGPHGEWIVDLIQAAIVVRCFEMVEEGKGLWPIAEWLRSLPELPRGNATQKRDGAARVYIRGQGKECWSQSRVSKLLHSRAYLGERRWGKRVFPVPPIVDPQLFERVQRVLARRSERHGPRSETVNPALLSGLLRCAHCGARYFGVGCSPGVVRREDSPAEIKAGLVRKYRCHNNSKGGATCKARAFRAQPLDDKVWALLADYLRNPGDILARVIQEDAKRGATLETLSADRLELEQQLGAIDKAVEDIWTMQRRNGWPLSVVEQGIQAEQAKKAAIHRKLEALRLESGVAEADRAEVQKVAAAMGSLRGLVAQANQNPAARAQLASLFVGGGEVRTIAPGKYGAVEVTLWLRWGEALQARIDAETSGGGADPCLVLSGSKQGPSILSGVQGRQDSLHSCNDTQRPLSLPFSFRIGPGAA
jgi:site-specific DNA recombinase